MVEVLDKSKLMQQLDGDLEFLAETVQMLHDEGPLLIAEVREAMRSGNCEATRAAAHTIKGMLGNFCAERAFNAAATLEQLAESEKLSECAAAIDTVEKEVRCLEAALAELLQAGDTDTKTSIS